MFPVQICTFLINKMTQITFLKKKTFRFGIWQQKHFKKINKWLLNENKTSIIQFKQKNNPSTTSISHALTVTTLV